jgi:hypothetical protein
MCKPHASKSSIGEQQCEPWKTASSMHLPANKLNVKGKQPGGQITCLKLDCSAHYISLLSAPAEDRAGRCISPM